MAIFVKLDDVLHDRRMTLSELAERFFRSSGGLDIAEGMEDFDGKELKKIGFIFR